MNKPNIFQIATKELSQDGFFTWLLQWADSSNQQFNTELHECAKNFVRFLISKQIELPDNFAINKVSAGRQWKDIDIWAEINDDILIVIEDKTYTKQHSKQLERYKKIAQDYCDKKKYQLVCVYLKIGSESKSSLNDVTKKGYAVVDRHGLLDFFSQYQIKNDIFTDFVDKINSLDESEKSYETLPIGRWKNQDSWSGFYQFLDDNLDVNSWEYVANPAGGFLGLWWHFEEWEGYYVYLQIEQGNLCLKIGDVAENHSEVRQKWYSVVMNQAKQERKKEIQKPQRFGSGTYMTVAIVERKDWLGADNDMLDKEKVIERLKEYERFLDKCLK